MTQRNKYYRILSFDGGGVRGVLSAFLLLRLANECPEIIENTDLFVGTSVGSFIALALASGVSPEEIVELFSYKNTKKIFGNPKPYYFCKPKYSNQPLKKLLTQLFPESLRLCDLKKHVVIPSFQLYSKKTETWEPIFFNNFPASDNAHVPVIDVALASSAAPIYFPSHLNCIDGGVIANNPDTAAIGYAVGMQGANAKLDNVVHMSFGTGWNPLRIRRRNPVRWGLIQWMYSFLPGYSNPKLPLFSILTDGDVAADMQVSSHLLNTRYLRVSPELNERIHLDDYKKVPLLIEMAKEYDLFPASAFAHTYWNEEKMLYRPISIKI